MASLVQLPVELLRTFIDHQTYHRGQMTVLLRQAGLTVPDVLGQQKKCNNVLGCATFFAHPLFTLLESTVVHFT